MTLSPEDLPSAGAQQLHCSSCLGEHFKVIVDLGQTEVLCATCDQPNGRWPFTLEPSAGPSAGMAQRDAITTQTPQPPQVHAAWTSEAAVPGEKPPQSDERTMAEMTAPPPLPAISPDLCNVVLDGGAYDGSLIFAPEDVVTFRVAGLAGEYRRTAATRDGRAVFTMAPYEGMTDG